MPVIDIEEVPASIQRRLRWQEKQRKAKRCPICADPVARICMNKKCTKYRKSVQDVKCTGRAITDNGLITCGKKTRAVRLCATHLLRDRARKPKRGPK